MAKNGQSSESLPKSWEQPALEEVCEILDSRRIPVNNAERQKRIAGKKPTELYPYYGATGQVGVIDDYIFEGEHVLLGEDGAPFLDPFKDKAYIASGKFWVNNHAHILRTSASNQYLCYYLNYCDYSEFVTGTTRLKLNQAVLKSIPVRYAPENEQERIVSKIEQLFSELDKGIECLKTARQQLKVYRQAVLKHAFEGKLTEKWRDENRGKLQAPGELLERIRAERQKLHEEQIEEWEVAARTWEESGKAGKKPSKPRTPKTLGALSDTERKHLADLPDGWCSDKLGWMTCGVEYGTSAKSSDSGDVPVLRMGNIQNGKFDWSDLVYTSDKEEIAKYELAPGDVLFNRTNSPELVGKTAIFRGERQAIFAGYLIRVNQIPAVVDSQYLNLYLNSHTAKQYGNQVKTDGVNQSNINGEKLQNYPFPFCSIDEQKEVVRILDEKLSITDQMEADIDKELLVSSALRQTILKRAFSGQLVEQDPSDEPAYEFLARINAEKEEQEKTKRARNKKVKKKSKRKDAA